ncbi:toxin-antitoxin system YwqK family antitoxin [Pseudoduganella violaceinigra]|uniref:toxin-antitoxin system YwqK family antitoxin n=1 Tax=Pseudoduganella violaceinigra TaxID=246602 RepID=UPI00040B28FE|nr:hypothetical protein [Pseudoduganella violaceinigra]
MDDSSKEYEVRDEQGRLTGRFRLADGKLHGRSTLYSGGGIIAEICYAQGLRQGEMRSYGADGALSSVVVYAADLPHGEASYFHADGGAARIANYKEGRLHGEVRDFAPDGKLLSTSNYIEGELQPAPVKAEARPERVAGGERKSWLARLVEGA